MEMVVVIKGRKPTRNNKSMDAKNVVEISHERRNYKIKTKIQKRLIFGLRIKMDKKFLPRNYVLKHIQLLPDTYFFHFS